ncbi:hypothetical protein D3C85_1551020 [compost metagenome]
MVFGEFIHRGFKCFHLRGCLMQTCDKLLLALRLGRRVLRGWWNLDLHRREPSDLKYLGSGLRLGWLLHLIPVPR